MLKPKTLKKKNFYGNKMPGRQKTWHWQNKNRDNGNDTSSTLVNVKDIVSVVSIGKSCSPLFCH